MKRKKITKDELIEKKSKKYEMGIKWGKRAI